MPTKFQIIVAILSQFLLIRWKVIPLLLQITSGWNARQKERKLSHAAKSIFFFFIIQFSYLGRGSLYLIPKGTFPWLMWPVRIGLFGFDSLWSFKEGEGSYFFHILHFNKCLENIK